MDFRGGGKGEFLEEKKINQEIKYLNIQSEFFGKQGSGRRKKGLENNNSYNT